MLGLARRLQNLPRLGGSLQVTLLKGSSWHISSERLKPQWNWIDQITPFLKLYHAESRPLFHVTDQQLESTCQMRACLSALELAFFAQTGHLIFFDVQRAIFWGRLFGSTEGDYVTAGGRIVTAHVCENIIEAMGLLSRYGVPVHPDCVALAVRLCLPMERFPHRLKITCFRELMHNDPIKKKEQIMEAIMANGAIPIGIMSGRQFRKYVQGVYSKYDEKKSKFSVLGGHALSAVGFRPYNGSVAIYFQNCWGTSVHVGGFGELTLETIFTNDIIQSFFKEDYVQPLGSWCLNLAHFRIMFRRYTTKKLELVVYISFWSEDVSSDDIMLALRELWPLLSPEDFGERVIGTFIVRDWTGRPRGFGYVKFGSS